MDRHPRPVVIAQKFVIPLGVVFFIGVAIWQFGRGDESAGFIGLALAGISLASIPVFRFLSGRSDPREARAAVTLMIDADSALRQVSDALRVLELNGEVVVDAQEMTAWVDVPPSWRSYGERVYAVVQRAEAGSTIEVTSQLRWPQLVDFGRNRSNVEAVIQVLAEPTLDQADGRT